MDTITILIVDDHPVIRKGMDDLLAKALDIEIVGETGDGDEALQMARELKPDVMLLDMQIQGLSGIEVAKTLQNEGSSVRVLGVSGHNDREYIQGLLKSGAFGYLNKGEAPEFILSAVRGVAYGERGWISRDIVAKLANWQRDENPSPTSLTDRENQILKQLVEAKTNTEIAYFLKISPKTVEKHLESIFRKLGVVSRTEAAVFGAREAMQKSESRSGYNQ
jgi:DNA-binding NarL/FixJ family response regulator